MNPVLARFWKHFPLTTLRQQPWAASTAIAPRFTQSQPIEEEKTPYYSPEHFYPARLGEILHDRYQIATKLGYGSGSTVWLARDLWRGRWMSDRYVAIKTLSNGCTAGEGDACPELAILRRIARSNPWHEGWQFVRRLVDDFSIGEANCEHVCLVFEPLREPLWLYQRRFKDRCIPADILKILVQMILHGLDYLHSECQIIHADLKLDNIMVRFEDMAVLEREAKAEFLDPLPQKHIDGRVIYLSRNDYGAFARLSGLVQIVDFDRSVLGTIPQSGPIQADTYRAPEVILDAGFTYSADIWSLGVLLWELLEDRRLFNVIDKTKVDDYDEDLHVALITSLLGPQPKSLVTGRRSSMFYDSEGHFKRQSLVPKQFSFESTVQNIKGEEKQMFIKFVKRMITWDPNERSTAKELLNDPWLYTDFPQD